MDDQDQQTTKKSKGQVNYLDSKVRSMPIHGILYQTVNKLKYEILALPTHLDFYMNIESKLLQTK